jgi:hypothetical protein
MSPNYCEKCNAECDPDPQASGRWICPICQGVLVKAGTSDTMTFREALGVHGHSDQLKDGLSSREFAQTVGFDNEASAMEVERNNGGPSEFKRTSKPTKPSPRDPRGERKKAEERACVNAMLPVFNLTHGSSYDSVKSGDDPGGVDVIAFSQRTEEPAIEFQLTHVDTDEILWESVALGIPYSSVGAEAELMDRFGKAMSVKFEAPIPNAILILDGAGIVTTAGTIERLVREYKEDLRRAKFREVWYVDPTPGGVIRRIAPLDVAITT